MTSSLMIKPLVLMIFYTRLFWAVALLSIVNVAHADNSDFFTIEKDALGDVWAIPYAKMKPYLSEHGNILVEFQMIYLRDKKIVFIDSVLNCSNYKVMYTRATLSNQADESLYSRKKAQWVKSPPSFLRKNMARLCGVSRSYVESQQSSPADDLEKLLDREPAAIISR